MADQPMPSTYETSTTVHSRPIGVKFNPDYLRTIPGILKIVEIILDILVLICTSIVGYGGGGWVFFVAISTFVSTLVWLILYVLGLRSRLPAIVVLVEFIYYAIFTVFYLIAAIVAAAYGHYDAAIGATAFFAFAATAVYAVDTYFQYKNWRLDTTETTISSNTTTTTTTTTSTNVEAKGAVY